MSTTKDETPTPLHHSRGPDDKPDLPTVLPDFPPPTTTDSGPSGSGGAAAATTTTAPTTSTTTTRK